MRKEPSTWRSQHGDPAIKPPPPPAPPRGYGEPDQSPTALALERIAAAMERLADAAERANQVHDTGPR